MNKAVGAFLILLVNAIFAFVFSLEQFALVHSYPLFITGLRMLIGGVSLFGYQWYADKNAFSFKVKQAKLATSWLIFLLAFFNVYVTNGAEIWGLQYVSGAKAAFISNLAPFASAFFSYFYFNETMNGKKFLGLIIALLGFMPVILMQTACEKNLSHIGFLTSADFALLLATITFVYGWILMQQLIKKGLFDYKAANAVSMLLGSLFCFAHSLITEPWYPLPVKEGVDWPSLWLLIISMVVLSNIIAYLAYSALLKRYTATFLSFTSFSSYLCAALYDWLFAGLLVSWQVWVGSAIFMVGLYIFYKEEQAQGYT
jgi:drug/metabolite transporter (DMT)-like permease